MIKFLKSLLSKKIKNQDLEIRFHKQANLYGEHGTIVVSHVRQGLIETPVRFVFVGVFTPPKMDLRIFNYIWEEARAQGYIPHHINTYGMENEIDCSRKPLMAATEANVHSVAPLFENA